MMKKLNPKNCTMSVCACIFFALLFACQSNPIDADAVNGTKEQTVTLAVNVPGSSTPTTRGLTDTQENDVTEIDVLVFNSSTGAYAYSARATGSNNISSSGTNGKTKTFTVTLQHGTWDIVILANARNEVSAAEFTGKTRSDVYDDLIYVISTEDDKWVADGTQPFPMWGEVGTNIVIDSSTDLTSTPTTLHRMVARVDVAVDAEVTHFNLESVRVYNYNTEGTIAPDVSATGWDAVNNKALFPHVLSGFDTTMGPLVYENTTASMVVASNACIKEIYILEAENVSADGTIKELTERTCLVIGGKYGTDTEETFYRVDFSSGNGVSQTFLNILRNHQYVFTITAVGGAGFDTPEEAFNSEPVNMTANVVEWNNGDISDVVFDGQYYLGVSPSLFNFSRDAITSAGTDNFVTLLTDYVTSVADATDWAIDGGYNTSDDSLADWLTFHNADGTTISGGAANVKTKVYLHLTENTTGSERQAIFYITAGRLKYKVTVNQSIASALTLNIVDDSNTAISELVFASNLSNYASTPTSQSFIVNWTPADADLMVVNNTQAGSIAFPSGDATGTPTTGTITDGDGSQRYTIAPPSFTAAEIADDPFIEKSSTIEFSTTDGVSSVIGSVLLKQINYALIASGGSYQLDGSTYTFYVKSNASWRIKSIEQNANTGSGSLLNLSATGNLVAGTTGGYNTSPGDAITFTVQNDMSSGLSGTVVVVFENTDNSASFEDVYVTLTLYGSEYYPAAHSGWAGSNIYWDGTKLTFDDVDDTTHQYYQGVFFQWGSLWGIAPNGTSGDDWSPSVVLYSPTGSTEAGKEWASWPQIGSGNITTPADKNNRDRNYLYEITDASTGLGDICKYLTIKAGGTIHGKKWRMPTSNEFEAGDKYKKYGDAGYWNTNINTTSAEGKYLLQTGWKKTDISDITPSFPASGRRNHSNGSLYNGGEYGYYWSGSPNGNRVYYMQFDENSVDPAYYESYRARAFPVRCVAE